MPKAPRISMPKMKMTAPAFRAEHTDGGLTIHLPNGMKMVARYGDSRDGFNHFATLYNKEGGILGEAKIHYINRTWESYDYQSVLRRLLNDKSGRWLSDKEKEATNQFLNSDLTDWSGFKSIAAFGALAEVLGTGLKQKNELKMKAVKSLKGLEVPEEWENLPEAEKAKRLDKTLELIGNVGANK